MLTADLIEFFHANGYLAIERLMPDDEVVWMREIYDRLFAERAGWETGDQFDLAGTDEEGKEAVLPQILGPAKYAPELRDSRLWANAAEVVRDLLGPEAAFGDGHMIFKPPRTGAETPWHQDEAYWDPSLDYTSLSIWVPLQEATVANGCMGFVPGSHRLEVLPHQSVGGDVRVHALEVLGADVSRAVMCPLPAGGATFHLSRTLHYAGPNTTDIPRRAYILSGGLAATPRNDGRRFPWNEAKQTARAKRAGE
ncbi:MAG: phytanoyl-CoA dioxygenase family protein [Fimbriimonadaceae bacterium]|nr:phytanoyl-CoA dioxygenase family protein [Chthonomonadaceae bacterium]MCO5297373.1 phytanoyl-CoA dioxygenase family protein [Fimbriimonadaceae bacterium]